MQVTNHSDAEVRLYPAHRIGRSVGYRLLAGSYQGEPDDFEFSFYETDEAWNLEKMGSPRHVHDFDQLRFPLAGPMNYAPGKDIPEGAIGYFPEGTPYGPFAVTAPKGGGAFLLLQFGGPSGAGFVDSERLKTAHEELSKIGRFENGKYHYQRYDGDNARPRTKDAHHAILEQARGRRVAFPKGRYAEPLVIVPKYYPWVAGSEPGVWTRQLGIFNERGTAIEMLKLEAGKSHVETGRDQASLAFLIKGAVDVEDQLCERNGAICWRPQESLRMVAREKAEFYIVRLPAF